MMTTFKNTGSCFVMVPSYDKEQNVNAIKTGSTGMTTFVTMESTICWNSSRTSVITSALVHVAARPRSSENTRALMTGMIWGISSWNTMSGSFLSSSTSEIMDRWGIRK